MKTCPTCGRQYADTTTLCPADGSVLQRRAGEDRLVGQVLAGKYRIDEKIDEGGMGCVYRATHVLMEKVVAVKVLHPALAADDKIVARFTREAKAASRISHPHAINVTDFGESDNGVVYLVMEYLRGRTLKDVVRSGGPMTLARTTEIVRQVAGALEAAHTEGVVHRDLKSDNIMLEEATGGDWAKVLDFGIAKIQQTERSVHETDPGLTAPNLIIGTPQYMSPEQCSQASDIDTRSDIYSFGVILYEMLAGHVPFTGDSPTAIMMKHIQEPAPSILEERKDLPAEVGRVIARALAKRPEDRFQKAGELAAALAASAETAPLTAAVVAAPATLDTERIGSPTSPNEPARTTVGRAALDEDATVVSSGYSSAAAATATADDLPPVVTPLPEPSFNPWRIAVPAIAVVAIIFAVFFAFQRRGVSSDQQSDQPPLQADPNGQAVQPITPPTGQAERELAPAGGAPTPSAPPTGDGAAGATAGGVAGGPPAAAPGENANAAAPSASPSPQARKVDEVKEEPPEEDEPEEDEPAPTPTPRRERRLPQVNANMGPPPPPPKQDKPKDNNPPDAPPSASDAPPAPTRPL
ncbi:MAG TPA: protein kinase [Pyrinomonadaceae bacterium]|jgi:serine/threonine protein kinase